MVASAFDQVASVEAEGLEQQRSARWPGVRSWVRGQIMAGLAVVNFIVGVACHAGSALCPLSRRRPARVGAASSASARVVQRVARRAGERRGQGHGLLQWQLGQQHAQHARSLGAQRRLGAAARRPAHAAPARTRRARGSHRPPARRALGRRQRERRFRTAWSIRGTASGAARGTACASASARASMRCGASNSTCVTRAAIAASAAPRALAGLRRQEADEARSRAAARIAGHAERGQCAAGTGNRQHAIARLRGLRHQHGTRVGHRRRAGIADIGHALAARQALQHLGARPRVRCAGAARSAACPAQVAQQRRALTRVSSQATASTRREHMYRAQAQVGEVADGRRHHVQRAGRILLHARRFGGSLHAAARRWRCSTRLTLR